MELLRSSKVNGLIGRAVRVSRDNERQRFNVTEELLPGGLKLNKGAKINTTLEDERLED